MADTGSDKPTRDVDDISLDDARPARKGGGGGGIVLILVLLIAIAGIIWYVLDSQAKQRIEAERQAKMQAEAREAQIGKAKENLQAALNANAAGDLGTAISHLRTADNMLGNIVSTANSEGNTEAAAEVLRQKGHVAAALSAIQAAANEHMSALATQFQLQPTTAAPAAADATTPATPETPATGTEAPALPDAGAPAAPAAPDAAAPVAPAAPAAPVAPEPAAAPAPMPAS